VAAELAQKISDTLKQNKDVDATAKQFAAQANMNVAEMIRETGYVQPGDNVPNIGNSPQFEEGIQPLEAVQDVGDKTPIQGGFAVPMLVDKKEPRDAEFDEVKDKLVEVVKMEQARNKIEQIANQIAAGSSTAGGLSAAAIAANMKAKEQKTFILGSPLGEGPSATTSEALEDAIYAMKEGESTKTPIKIGDAYYIVGVTKRTEANMDDFAKQRDDLMEQMLTQKRGEVFQDYLAATRSRLETAGSIKVYKDVVDKLDDADLPTDLG
jgi:parvulin-like peptidyl-prolyl isomerase